jgi:hypothetical protein
MRWNSWIVGGLLMIIMVVAVVAVITTGSRWLLTASHSPPDQVQSGPLPKTLTDGSSPHHFHGSLGKRSAYSIFRAMM